MYLKEVSHVKKLLAGALIGIVWMLSAATAHAQMTPQTESATHTISNQDIDLLRKDLRAKRRELVAANLKLNDIEAAKFWPVYDQYIAELITINDKKFSLIQEYADNWGKLTNEESLLFTRNWLDMDIATAQLPAKVCAHGGQDSGRNEDSDFFPTGPTHCDDDGSAGFIADAPGAGTEEQRSVLDSGSLSRRDNQGHSARPQ